MFDITKHKWSDKAVDEAARCFCSDELWFDSTPDGLIINKQDAIAIAKHFGIIQEIDGQTVTIHKAEVKLQPEYLYAFKPTEDNSITPPESEFRPGRCFKWVI